MERSFNGDEVSRIRFQAHLLDVAGQAVIATDTGGKIVYWNNAAERIYGWPAEETVGHSANEILVSDELRERAAEIMAELRNGNSWSGEFTVLRRDGTSLQVLTSNTPVYDREGTLVGIVGVSADITDRKQMEEALRESEKKFRTQYQGFPIPTYSWRRVRDDFVLIDYNDAAYDITRGSIADLLGRRASDLYRDKPEVLDWLTRCYHEKVNISEETWWTLESTGDTKYFQITFVFVPPNLVMVHTNDFTERKKAEDGLRESEERFKAQYRGVPIPTSSWRWNGEDFVLTDFNEAAVEMTSGAVADLVGKKISEVYGDKPEVLEWFSRCFNERTNIKEEMWWTPKTTGETKYYVVDFAYVPPDTVMVHTQDLTERKQAEEEIRRSEERFRKLFDEAFEGVLIHDRDEILNANQTLADMLGYEKDELIGQPGLSFVAPEDVPKVREHFQSGSEEPFEGFALRKDGTRLDVEARGRNFFYEGRWVRLASLRDITGRKRAEEALRRSEEQAQRRLAELQTIYHTAPVGLAFMDRDLRFVKINEELAAFNGFPVEEHIGKTLGELLPAELAGPVEQMCRRVLETDEPVTEMEFQGETPARPGETRNWLTSFHPVKDEAGMVLGINVLVQDVTERKRAEKALEASENRLSLIYQNTTDVLFLLAVEPDEVYRFVSVNDAFLFVTGLTREQIVGKRFEEVMPPSIHDLTHEKLREALREDRTIRWEEVALLPAGLRYGDLTVTPTRDEATGQRFLVGSARDITRLREEEQRSRLLSDAALEALIISEGFTDESGNERRRIVGLNRAVTEIFGYGPEEFASRTLRDVIAPEFHEVVERNISSDYTGIYQAVGVRKDGTRIDLEIRGSMTDFQGRRVRVTAFRDITERKRAENRLKILAEASRSFAEAGMEYRPLLNEISRNVSDNFGDICGIAMYSDDGRNIEATAVYHPDPEVRASLREMMEIPFRPGEGITGRVVQTGEPVFVPEIAPEQLYARVQPEHRPYLERIGVYGMIVVPLRVRGEVRGALFLARTRTEEPYTEGDRGLAEDLAGRAALAIDGALLYRTARTEIAERERAENRLKILAEASRSFAEAGMESQPLFDTIARTVSDNFGDFCGVALISGDGDVIEPASWSHPDPEVLSQLREVLGRSVRVGEGITGKVVQAGELVFLPEITPDQVAAMASPRFGPQIERMGVRGMIVVPLRARGEIMGAISLARTRSGEPYTEEDRALVEELTERAALAIDNSLLYEAAEKEIAERERAEEEYRELFENHPQPMWIYDTETLKFLAVNRAAVSHYGYSREEFLSMTIADIRPEEDGHGVREAAQAVAEGARYLGEWKHRKKDGTVFDVEVSSHATTFEGRSARLVRAADITERKVLEDQLAHQAFHDALTGLPNRALFTDRLGHALVGIGRSEGGVAVLFADLDNFKAINDSFGHETGDQLLVAVADRLRSCVRPEDTLARFGGDEFVILLADVRSPTDVVRVASRVAEELREPFGLGGREVFVSASIGISLEQSEDALPEIVLRNADTAMYQAKGRDGVSYEIFEPGMYARVLGRLEMENDLRLALEREEFRVHYQPQVGLQSGRIVGMEALVRWENPERGLISPAEFIPLAEETGLIVPLGRWVLEEACRQAWAWRSEQPEAGDLVTCVNLSLRQFQNPGLLDEVADALRESGLDPHCLVLEITESVAMKDAEFTVVVLQELKKLGVRLAIDDFGKGHSSLTYLIKRFHMDVLKIDRSFIAELARDADYETIVAGITGIARSLNLRVVAEGIETAEQHALVKSVGCDTGQGFYFSRPVPSEEASALLAADTRW